MTMNKDRTYCIRRNCPKYEECGRQIKPTDITDETWLFGGCPEDYCYYIPKPDDNEKAVG